MDRWRGAVPARMPSTSMSLPPRLDRVLNRGRAYVPRSGSL